jgi:hypothetical protein
VAEAGRSHRGRAGRSELLQLPGPAINDIVGAEVSDPTVDMFISDIENGIADTGVKAGMLKCAIDDQGLNPGWSVCYGRWPEPITAPGSRSRCTRILEPRPDLSRWCRNDRHGVNAVAFPKSALR